jgi:hypothetical protein
MLLLNAASGWPQAAAPASSGVLQSLTQRLGIYVFPGKGQNANQQTLDESDCYAWAKDQSGFDPLASPPQTAANQTAASPSGKATAPPGQGSAVKGAAGGAAIGAVAGNAGKGAAIGATVGVLHRARVSRQAEKEAQAKKQQDEAAASQNQAQVSQQLGGYNKAFSACLEGKGYTVK